MDEFTKGPGDLISHDFLMPAERVIYGFVPRWRINIYDLGGPQATPMVRMKQNSEFDVFMPTRVEDLHREIGSSPVLSHVLAHELGHALSLMYREPYHMAMFSGPFKDMSAVYPAEVAAWDQAERIAKSQFDHTRKACLRSYQEFLSPPPRKFFQYDTTAHEIKL